MGNKLYVGNLPYTVRDDDLQQAFGAFGQVNSAKVMMERDTEFRDTVVTLLIDNSGSMRGRPITVAAMCADILARTLERCAVKVEILGFTTRAWKGGLSRDDWISLWWAQENWFWSKPILIFWSEALSMGTLETLSAAIDAKDRYTCGHSQRVALLSRQLALAAVGLDRLDQQVGRSVAVDVRCVVHEGVLVAGVRGGERDDRRRARRRGGPGPHSHAPAHALPRRAGD